MFAPQSRRALTGLSPLHDTGKEREVVPTPAMIVLDCVLELGGDDISFTGFEGDGWSNRHSPPCLLGPIPPLLLLLP